MNPASLRRRFAFAAVVSLALTAMISCPLRAQDAPKDKLGYQDTPMIPGTNWHVHDGLRPQPTIVTPASTVGKPPSDATVLFNGKDLSAWRMGDGKPGAWKLEKGAMVSNRTGDIFTKEEFGDFQLHIEWATPSKVEGNGQGRGNSGIFLQGRYEIQVLDCYDNPTYPDGQAGSVYGQTPPLVNASLKPGEWQQYDIFFTAPRFEGETLKTPAYVTVVHNGVLVQNHTEIIGDTMHRDLGRYLGNGTTGPLKLQDHGNPTRFRNIWVRKI